MRLPGRLPPAHRAADFGAAPDRSPNGAIEPQGCNVFEAAACVGAIAVCVTSALGAAACLATIAPNCIKCL